MFTRIEIDGFKSFDRFVLDLNPLTAIVGPNASGKSNLFDAIRFLSSLAQHDIRTAMLDLRGEPEELFRQTAYGSSKVISFAVEVILDRDGIDAFGTRFEIKSQRLRYELKIELQTDANDIPRGVVIAHEQCKIINKKSELLPATVTKNFLYSARKNAFLETETNSRQRPTAFLIRQDGRVETGTKRGRPVTIPAGEASRSALSTITTAEFPHLYALKQLFTGTRFLEINPYAARNPSDRFELRQLKSDASNLSAVLSSLRDETSTPKRPDGVVADISSDLTSLIPLVSKVEVNDDPKSKEVSFSVVMRDGLNFSSRVISDGTLRLLALLAVLDDPSRKGVLCFEEPENGVHEGRIGSLIQLLRSSATPLVESEAGPYFQILLNTHSPAVMAALQDNEIAAADTINIVDVAANHSTYKTRMRTGVTSQPDLIDKERFLTRGEVDALLRRGGAFV